MTQYQTNLVAEAKDMWQRGFNIPEAFYARMTMAGLDVDGFKSIYKEEK
jgi:hypothetical protein